MEKKRDSRKSSKSKTRQKDKQKKKQSDKESQVTKKTFVSKPSLSEHERESLSSKLQLEAKKSKLKITLNEITVVKPPESNNASMNKSKHSAILDKSIPKLEDMSFEKNAKPFDDMPDIDFDGGSEIEAENSDENELNEP